MDFRKTFKPTAEEELQQLKFALKIAQKSKSVCYSCKFCVKEPAFPSSPDFVCLKDICLPDIDQLKLCNQYELNSGYIKDMIKISKRIIKLEKRIKEENL